MKLVVGEYVACWVYSHLYLAMDKSVGEAAAPDGRCTPILLVPCLFQVALGGTKEVYDVGLGKESLSKSLSMSSIKHVEGLFCLERRDGRWGMGVLIWACCFFVVAN
jgi:hypothetical protein